MTGVEERLTELLHAAAPPSEGVAFDAVQRQVHRRHAVRAAVAASVATVAVVAGAIALLAPSDGGHSGGVATTPTVEPTVNLTGTVPWVSTPAGPYQAPTAPPRKPATGARPCTASDVTAKLADGDGAGGHTIRYVMFGNTGRSTCVLKGYPQRVVASESGHPDVAGTNGSFFPTSGTANMRPGQSAFLGLETDTACPARPGGGPPGPAYHHVAITLPGGGTVRLDDPSRGFDVTCGLHLTKFFVQQSQQAPHDPLGDLQVSLEVPQSVAAGSTLVYVADLTNPTARAISLDRCPGYVEAADGPAALKETYALNCAPVHAIPAHGTVRFAMQLRVPAGTPGGPITLRWALAGPFSVTGDATVDIQSAGHAAPGATVSGFLRMTGGPAGGSQPGVPGLVRFDGTGGRHFWTKANDDGVFALSVTPGQYTVTGTSPQFESGNGVCRADGPVRVPGSGLSGVVVACSRK